MLHLKFYNNYILVTVQVLYTERRHVLHLPAIRHCGHSIPPVFYYTISERILKETDVIPSQDVRCFSLALRTNSYVYTAPRITPSRDSA